MSLDKILYPIANRVRRDITARRHIGTTDKPFRSDLPLTAESMKAHVDGSGSPVGVYFIKPGESECGVAALDLDSHKGETPWSEMLQVAWRVAETLREKGLIANPWRSGGGAGVHLWFIWETPQDAYSVRRVLTEAIEAHGFTDGKKPIALNQIQVFPGENNVSPGSFGHQLWLPLCRKSVPLIPDLLEDGWRAGRREDATGYEWAYSEDVSVMERPAQSLALTLPTLGQEADIPKLQQLLDHIKLDVEGDYSYDLWRTVGMALHWSTGGAEEGLQAWAAWSALGVSCPDLDELRGKWASFDARGKGRDGLITVRTLEKLARDGGWIEDIEGLFEVVQVDGKSAGDAGDPLPPPAPVILNERDHLAIAKKIISERFKEQGTSTLIRSAATKDWFVYGNGYYQRRIDEIVNNDVHNYLGRAKKVKEVVPRRKKGDDGGVRAAPVQLTIPFDPTPAQISAVFGALKVAAAGPHDLEAPMWLEKGKGRSEDYIVLADGVLHAPTRALEPLTPKLFTVNALPYGWNGGASACPQWLKFLSEVFPDKESIDCLQEIIGYLVSSDTSMQKMFLIKGLPRSGKGTIERITHEMLGDNNVAGTTLNQLGEDFGLWPLMDKSAVFISESRNTKAGNDNRMGVAIERLLMISGEDSLLINTKGGKYHEARLRCRVVLTANEVPALGDSTGAFASRFITLTTQNSWLGREDITLTERLCTELSGILKWSLDGLDRLKARGRFMQPAAGAKVLEELADAQNPVRRFLKENCVLGENETVPKQELYDAYRFWQSDNGMGYRNSAQNWFSRGLVNAYRELQKKEIVEYRKDKNAPWSWGGVNLKNKTL